MLKKLIIAILLSSFTCSLFAEPDQAFIKQVQDDWLLQEQYRFDGSIPTRSGDATGGCDGIINGGFGFNTGIAYSPWWQVDLGSVVPISRVRIWNRCDELAKLVGHLKVYVSDDGVKWETVYEFKDGVFYGFTDKKPLNVELESVSGRFVRIENRGMSSLHLDEIEVFSDQQPGRNLALNRPADQKCVRQDFDPDPLGNAQKRLKRIREIHSHCRELIKDLQADGLNVNSEMDTLSSLEAELAAMNKTAVTLDNYFQARWLQRKLTLKTPLMNFDSMLFVKRVPGSYIHMSDQYYGWWSRPGGGIYILRNFKTGKPTTECITTAFKEPGSFLRPMLSYDGRKVLFAWCKYYPGLAEETDKLNKDNVPEDAFYHVFEINIDGSGLRQMTNGKYDDFDARYLPDGRIVFLSTRRGQFIQCTPQTAAQTLDKKDLPDIYVRCGGGPKRPVAVYTLHTINPDGSGLCPISPFEMFEWTPSVAHDGTLLYSRWDYVDRSNQPWMSLWAMNPDGTNARLVYGNFTEGPNCTFEPRSIPNSNKIIFIGSGHHSQTMGTMIMLDQAAGTEGGNPIKRLTPEVIFPEFEGWPDTYYANPWPLSERFYLVSWGKESNYREAQLRSKNGMGLYLFDADGNMELLYRDPEITSATAMPLRERERPPVFAGSADWASQQHGQFLLNDVYQGLKNVEPGSIKALRIVAVPPKTHPKMNYPCIGHTRDDPGKAVLGTVPVEADGSAFFKVPAGVIVFFQALDERGMAVQSMRSATHVQPGQTLSCVGCHESRLRAPDQKRPMAASRAPSNIRTGPSGSWVLDFDRLIQPVLDKNCVSCHNPKGANKAAAKFDLTKPNSYVSLCSFGKPSLAEHVETRYRQSYSIPGGCVAQNSPILAKITDPKGHHDVKLDKESLERLIIWMDTYAQRKGTFSEDQEIRLIRLRQRCKDILIERPQSGFSSLSGSEGGFQVYRPQVKIAKEDR